MSLIKKIEAISTLKYMSACQIDIFKEELLMRKLSITQSQEKSKVELSQMDIVASDPIDKASIQVEIDNLNNEIAKRNTILKQINAAVEYIRVGDYGYCKSCGEEIGLSRLTANPVSLMDVNCQSFAEIKLRQESGKRMSLRY